MRFRKKIKVFPGFYLNISKSGISATAGVKGLSVNFGKQGAYLNTGIPGTGFYDRKKIFESNAKSNQSYSFKPETSRKQVEDPSEIKSGSYENPSSATSQDLKNSISDAFTERQELKTEIRLANNAIISARRKKRFANIILIGFLMKSFKEDIAEKIEYHESLEKQLKECFVSIDSKFDEVTNYKYSCLYESFQGLIESNSIWDVTSVTIADSTAKSGASLNITKELVSLRCSDINIIKSNFPAFHFQNKNGGDIYVYPTFIIVISNTRDFAVLDLKDVDLIFKRCHYIEESQVPLDTKIIEYQWAKVNKNGGPDLRFKDNYQVPVVEYGSIKFFSSSGLNEVYMFSNYEKSEEFARHFDEYQFLLKSLTP